MPSLIDIRRRVRSVSNTQQITKAMKMISAAKLRRAQDRTLGARPYGAMLRQILENVAEAATQNPDVAAHSLLAVRPEKRILVVVVTADRGLAGGFNSNLIRLAQHFVNRNQDKDLSFELVGRKGRDYFRRRTRKIGGEYIDLFRDLTFEKTWPISDSIIGRFSKEEIDAVYLFVNEFKNVMAPNVTSMRMLPVELPKTTEHIDYIYEQPPEELLASLLPWYVRAWLFRALVESAAAEHAARMTAMDAATNNAGEMIDNLTRYMNRVRQASITREIIEIVSGAAALE
jgi:F-type H+-transporting ATPase subunit gamma